MTGGRLASDNATNSLVHGCQRHWVFDQLVVVFQAPRWEILEGCKDLQAATGVSVLANDASHRPRAYHSLFVLDELADNLFLGLLERLPCEVWTTMVFGSQGGRLSEFRWHRSGLRGCELRSCRCPARTVHGLGNGWRMHRPWCRDDAGNRLSGRRIFFARDRCCYRHVVAVSIGRVVFDHPVRGRFAQTLSILVDGRLLVVVGLCIVDEALAVTFDLGEVGVRAAVKFFLRRCREQVPT